MVSIQRQRRVWDFHVNLGVEAAEFSDGTYEDEKDKLFEATDSLLSAFLKNLTWEELNRIVQPLFDTSQSEDEYLENSISIIYKALDESKS